MDLVWIVLSCQATQAERPDSLTQSKPNPHMIVLHSAQQILTLPYTGFKMLRFTRGWAIMAHPWDPAKMKQQMHMNG